MQITDSEWQIIVRAAKYTNGTQVPRRTEIEALRALQAFVKRRTTASTASAAKPISAPTK
jgi:hypothetical protein